MTDWNGLPDQPERSGWHWLKHWRDKIQQPFEWNADKEEWEVGMDGEGAPEEMVNCGYQYCSRCPTPSELAQMQADAARWRTVRRASRKLLPGMQDVVLVELPTMDVLTENDADKAADDLCAVLNNGQQNERP